MAEKTEQQLVEELAQKRDRFSKGQYVGGAPAPAPKKEETDGAPKAGWRKALENAGKAIKGQ